jgi:hypothetical protein
LTKIIKNRAAATRSWKTDVRINGMQLSTLKP